MKNKVFVCLQKRAFLKRANNDKDYCIQKLVDSGNRKKCILKRRIVYNRIISKMFIRKSILFRIYKYQGLGKTGGSRTIIKCLM